MRKVFLTGCLLALCVGMPVRSAMAVEDAIIAIVDDDVITVKDMHDYLRGIYSQLRIEGRSDAEIQTIMTQYEAKGVSQLVEDRLILAEANRQGMQIRPQAIEGRMAEIKKKYASSQEFLDAINKEGVTISDIRKKVEDQFKARYIVTRDVRDKISVNPKEVTDFYNDNPARFTRPDRVVLKSITIKIGASEEKAHAMIAAALKRLDAGEDFQVVAKAYSEFPDIGEVDLESLSAPLKLVIDGMKPGGVSDIVATGEALYILKLESRTSKFLPPLEDVKEEIYQYLFEEKFKQKFPVWLDGLRKKSYVEIKK